MNVWAKSKIHTNSNVKRFNNKIVQHTWKSQYHFCHLCIKFAIAVSYHWSCVSYIWYGDSNFVAGYIIVACISATPLHHARICADCETCNTKYFDGFFSLAEKAFFKQILFKMGDLKWLPQRRWYVVFLNVLEKDGLFIVRKNAS